MGGRLDRYVRTRWLGYSNYSDAVAALVRVFNELFVVEFGAQVLPQVINLIAGPGLIFNDIMERDGAAGPYETLVVPIINRDPVEGVVFVQKDVE